MCEPISCILHGYKRIESKIRPNKKVLIVGAGIIGNLWATLLHYKGVRNIIVSEFSEARRRITDKLGMSLSIIYHIIIMFNCSSTIYSDTDTVTFSGLGFSVISPSLLEEMDEETFDVVIDCTGSPAALQQSIGKTKYGATILVFGCAPIGKSMK